MAGLALAQTQTPILTERFPKTASTPHFVFLFEEDHRGAAAELIKLAEPMRERILSDLGTEAPAKAWVVLAQDLADMQDAAPPGAQVPSWASGMAFLNFQRILIRLSSQGGGAPRLDQTLAHEFAHLALQAAVPHEHLPRWFHEGFATYQSESGSWERTRTLMHGTLTGRLFSLEALSARFPTRAHEVELAYAQSIDFVSFLLEPERRRGFHRLIRLLTQGLGFRDAIEEAYDESLLTIEDDWRISLHRRFTWITVLTGSATLWTLVTLVFLLAYRKKRRERRLAIERMSDETLEEDLEFPAPPPDA